MPRPRHKTDLVSLDAAQAMRRLFGAPGHAHKRLRCGAPLSAVRDAFNGRPVEPEHARDIEARWGRFAKQFLQDPEETKFELDKEE